MTAARVSFEVAGQFVPFARQVADPFTKMAEAFRVVPELFVKKRLVVVAEVNVAFDPTRLPVVTFWRLVEPRTVNVEVTVEELPTKPP